MWLTGSLTIFFTRARVDEAERLFRPQLNTTRELLGEYHPDMTEIYFGLASVFRAGKGC